MNKEEALKIPRQPEKYTAYQIKRWDVDTEYKNGLWIPARPEGHNCWSWKHRWRLAWHVLIGKADALYWSRILP